MSWLAPFCHSDLRLYITKSDITPLNYLSGSSHQIILFPGSTLILCLTLFCHCTFFVSICSLSTSSPLESSSLILFSALSPTFETVLVTHYRHHQIDAEWKSKETKEGTENWIYPGHFLRGKLGEGTREIISRKSESGAK